MKVNAKFYKAVFILVEIARAQQAGRIVNSVILSKYYPGSDAALRVAYRGLRNAGLLESHQGRSTVSLGKPASDITLLDVLQASDETDGQLFAKKPKLMVEDEVQIESVQKFETAVMGAQVLFEDGLKKTTIADLI